MYQFNRPFMRSASMRPDCRDSHRHVRPGLRHIGQNIHIIGIVSLLSCSVLASDEPWQIVRPLDDSSARFLHAQTHEAPEAQNLRSASTLTSTTITSDNGWHETGNRTEVSSIAPNRRDTLLLSATGLRTTLEQTEKTQPSLTVASHETATARRINLDLFVGEVQVLGEVQVNRVAVGNGAIINAEVLDSGELLVIAASAGSSSLRLWHKDGRQTDYNIRVSATDPETRVHMQRMVRMRVRMVEFRKSALGKLGIDWSDGTSGPVIAAAGQAASRSSFQPQLPGLEGLSESISPFSTYFGVASNISSRINFLAQNGDAVTLAEPVLSAMNGGEASFLAGGEIPYPSIGEDGRTQVEFKEYGVKLDVAPLIDSAGNIRARVDTEISQLDASVSVQGAPGLLTRRAQTEVTVRSGETIVISGLLSSETGTDVDSVPGLGKLPVIGRFFRSKSQRNSVNELVIFVTPEVIEPSQPMINVRERRYLSESDKRVEAVRQQLPLME